MNLSEFFNLDESLKFLCEDQQEELKRLAGINKDVRTALTATSMLIVQEQRRIVLAHPNQEDSTKEQLQAQIKGLKFSSNLINNILNPKEKKDAS